MINREGLSFTPVCLTSLNTFNLHKYSDSSVKKQTTLPFHIRDSYKDTKATWLYSFSYLV